MSDDADWWRYYWAGWGTWNGETPDSGSIRERAERRGFELGDTQERIDLLTGRRPGPE